MQHCWAFFACHREDALLLEPSLARIVVVDVLLVVEEVGCLLHITESLTTKDSLLVCLHVCHLVDGL